MRFTNSTCCLKKKSNVTAKIDASTRFIYGNSTRARHGIYIKPITENTQT